VIPLLVSSVRLPRAVAHTAVSTSQGLSLALFPHGGQGVARRNAWRAMAFDTATARERRTSDAALRRATASGHPAGSSPARASRS
jgi:hypothetical protein